LTHNWGNSGGKTIKVGKNDNHLMKQREKRSKNRKSREKEGQRIFGASWIQRKRWRGLESRGSCRARSNLGQMRAELTQVMQNLGRGNLAYYTEDGRGEVGANGSCVNVKKMSKNWLCAQKLSRRRPMSQVFSLD